MFPFRKRSREAPRLGLVIGSASPAVAERIFAKIPRAFQGVTFDLLTEDHGARLFFRNIFNTKGSEGSLRLLLRLRKRYDMLVICGTGEHRLRFVRLLAFFLMRPHVPIFVFNEFAEGFWLDRSHRSNIRQHLKMRHLLFQDWSILIAICGLIVILPLIFLRHAIGFVFGKLAGGMRPNNEPAPEAAADSVRGYQSIENQLGEIYYRRGASFGEPEKAMVSVRERIETRRGVFEKLRSEGRLGNPFLEIGAGVSQTALMLRNEFGVGGAAVDISLHALEAAGEIASRLGYAGLPLRVCCDARWLPFESHTFPLVYCFQTLHHFADPAPILEEVKRVLAPGGHFFLSEEPIRRWLCLNLDRCERPEDLTGLNKWIFDAGLLRYIAEAYVGSKPEAMWGIVENQGISIKQWDRILSVFDEVEMDVSQLFTQDARILRRWLVGLGVSQVKAERLTAGLFGAELSGLCRVLDSTTSQPKPRDPQQICRCPDCHATLRLTKTRAASFECPNCGPFPQSNGVHLLFPRVQLEALYRDVALSPGGSPELLKKRSRTPHELVEGATIREVCLLNARGEETLSVESGEETVLRVRIECSRPIKDPVIGLIVRGNIAGKSALIYDTNTMWQKQGTGEYSTEDEIEARFHQQMNLGPGLYSVTVAIASHDAVEFFDWLEDSLEFQVVEASVMQGIVNLQSEIVVAKRASERCLADTSRPQLTKVQSVETSTESKS